MTEPDAHSPEQDEVFVAQILANEDKPDGIIIAARLAGFLNPIYPVRAMAEHHFNRPEIQAALRAARKEKKPLREHGEPTRESVFADLDVVIDRGLANNNLSAVVAGIKVKAQVAGLLKENVIHTHRLDVSALSDDQLAAIATRKPKVLEAEYTEVVNQSAGLGALAGPEKTSNA